MMNILQLLMVVVMKLMGNHLDNMVYLYIHQTYGDIKYYHIL